jgi:hypothetical protein
LPDTNEPSHILIEHLEAAAVFFRLARLPEAAGTVENLREGFEIDYVTAKAYVNLLHT